MRLKQYLNEHEDLTYKTSLGDLISKINKECRPFLSQTRSFYNKGIMIVRGMKYEMDMGLFTVRKDRRPLDMDEDMHRMFNDAFKRVFGKALRSECMFCRKDNITDEVSFSNLYGQKYIVFPIGNFDSYWSPLIADLYDDWSREVKEFTGFMGRTREIPSKAMYDGINHITSSYKKNHLAEYISGPFIPRREIMIDCDRYYAINEEFFLKNMDKFGKDIWK